MRRFSAKACLPVMMAALVLAMATPSQACLFFGGWWGAGYRPHSAGYGPSYSVGYRYGVGYAPSYSAGYRYSAGYIPSYSVGYSVGYVPTYSVGYAPTTSYYSAASTTCCSPCTSCVSCCSVSGNCDNCNSGDCELAADYDGSSPLQPTPDSAGSGGRNPTFIEEEDRGTGTNYDNDRGSDGFRLRDSGTPAANEGDMVPDPLDQPFGTDTTGRQTLRFKIPQTILDRREPAPSHPADQSPAGINKPADPSYPLLKLEEKITSRPMPVRTRLVERRSWKQPVLAQAVSRDGRELNTGWVPVPAPTQLAQK